jgi:Tfp pilus assembly protein PilN
MRAVNLLPSDMRSAAPKRPRGARPEPVQGIGSYILLGALALCVVALAGYILVGNGIKQREADLETARHRAASASAKAAALKPYADFEALASARVETVRGLAASRFDWEQALRDISRTVPGDVKLQSLKGDIGLPGSAADGGDALRGAIQAPAITLGGCASSQAGVARMMSRIKAVDGVTRVTLSKSESASGDAAAASATAESPCGSGNPPTFSLVVFFERSKAIAALAPSEAQGVPVPDAVNPSEGGSENGTAGEGGTEPANGGGDAQPQASSSSSTASGNSTSTPTTGSTP